MDMDSSIETVIATNNIPSDHQYSNAVRTIKKICPICKKEFPLNRNLSFHMMLHPSDKPFACDYCLQMFKTKEDLRKHTTDDHPSKGSYKCELCVGRVFSNVGNLNRHHTMNHTNEKRFKCIYCDAPFKEYGQYRTHEAAHDRVTNYQCTSCLVYFGQQMLLNKHAEESECTTKILKCCKEIFNTRMDYVAHTLQKHKKYKSVAHKCQLCGRTFPFAYLRNAHEQQCTRKPYETRDLPSATTSTRDAEGNIIKFQCDKCDQNFPTHREILRHLSIHSEPDLESKFICTICNKKMASYASLYMHRARHLNIKRYFCEFCNKGFLNRNIMLSHRRVHTKEMPFACKFCDKAFAYKKSILAHERIHTGERPFSCKYCEMQFMHFSARQNHERRHTGEKPYTCTVCGKSFLQHSTWKQHERTHKIECEGCGVVFTTRKDYKLHKKGGQCHQSEQIIEEVLPDNQIWSDQGKVCTDNDGNLSVYYQTSLT